MSSLMQPSSRPTAALLPTPDADSCNAPQKPAASLRRVRFASLDCLRGLAIVLMILSNYGTGGDKSAWWIFYVFRHSKWDGLSLADLACPLFVFSMGCAMAFSIDRPTTVEARKKAFRKALVRGIKLWLLGWFVKDILEGTFDVDKWRVGSVLGRLGASYVGVACVALLLPGRPPRELPADGAPPLRLEEVSAFGAQWAVMGALTLLYLLVIFLLRVPGCPTGYFGPGLNRTSASGELFPSCSGGATGYIDRAVYGLPHMRTSTCGGPPFCDGVDPNGFFATLPSIVHTFIGLTAGRAALLHPRGARVPLCARLAAWGGACGAAGLAVVWRIPCNKLLWSLSYVLFTSAIGFALLAILHLLVDERALWRGGVLRSCGKNPIFLYLGHETFNTFMSDFRVGSHPPPNSFHALLLHQLSHAFGGDAGAHAFYGVFFTLCWVGVAELLDRRGIHFTV